MGYPRDLADYTAAELLRELQRRDACRANGLCDYCGAALGSRPVCRYAARHNVTPTPALRG